MALPRFNLKDKKKNNSPILLIYRYGGDNVLRYHTGHYVNPKQFDTRTLVNSRVINSDEINSSLYKMRDVAINVRADMIRQGIMYTPKNFAHVMDQQLGKKLKNESFKNLALKLYREKAMEKGEKTQRQLKCRITNLIKIVGPEAVTDINLNTFKRVEAKLFEEKKAPSYVNIHMRLMRQIMNDASIYYNVNKDYMLYKLPHFKPKATPYNTPEELKRIYEYQYPSEALRNSANIYLVGCYTGLRVSDMMVIIKNPKKYIIEEDGIMMVELKVIKKTKKSLIIPMHPILKDIMLNYKFTVIEEQRLNTNLKKIGRLCGIDSDFTRVEYEGKRAYEKTYKKYELMSSHCARRSFATNAYKAGMELKDIMQFTGHSSEAQLRTYLKMEQRKTAIAMANHSFFNE